MILFDAVLGSPGAMASLLTRNSGLRFLATAALSFLVNESVAATWPSLKTATMSNCSGPPSEARSQVWIRIPHNRLS